MFKMKTFILSLLFLIPCINLNGQFHEDTISHDVETDSLSWTQYEYTSSNNFRFIESQSETKHVPEKMLVIRYKTSASLFISFGQSEVAEYGLIDRDGNNELLQYPGTNNVVEGLQIDRLYDLIILADNSIQTVGLVSTFANADQTSWIDMYSSMYEDASEWATQSEDIQLGLFEFVESTSWHDLEKTWFLQQFYGFGYPMPDHFKNKIPTRNDFDLNGGGIENTDCMCRPLRLTFNQSLNPRVDGIQTQQKDGIYQNTWGTPPSESFSKAGKRWVAWGIKGPAKYMQAWQETPRCTNGNTYENTMSSDEDDLSGAGTNFSSNTGGKQSIIRITWACVGFDDMIPENCQCERDPRIRVCYTYSGETMANAETLGGGWCRGGRGVAAYAEDHAFIAYNGNAANLDDIEIIDAGMMRAGVGCNYSVDWSDFLASLAKSGFYGVKAMAKAKTVVGIGVAVYYGIKLADEISNLFNGPEESFTGSCGSRTAQGPGLIEGCFTRQLNQNKETVVMLQSNGKVHVEGKGRHKGTARILSSFGLTTTMQRSDVDQIGPVCCRTGNGVYSLAHTPGNPFSSLPGLQSWARNNFIADGLDQVDYLGNMNGEYGFRDGGGINEECALQILNVTPRTTRPNFEGGATIANINVSGHTLQIENITDTEQNLIISDVSGRTFLIEKIAPLRNFSYDISVLNVPAGMYFYRLSGSGLTYSGKMVKY
jgi:hypothetical protein